MSLKGLVLLADGLDFRGHLFDLLLEEGNTLIALLADLFDLFFQRLDLIFIEFVILLGLSHLHLLLYLQHLDLLYHAIETLDQFLLLLEIEGLLSDADLAGLDLH